MNRLWLIVLYTAIFLGSDLFLKETRTILVAFVFNVSIFLVIIDYIKSKKTKNKAWLFMKDILVFFWFGQIAVYLISLRNIDQGYEYWIKHVYDKIVLVSAYSLFLIFGIVYNYARKR